MSGRKSDARRIAAIRAAWTDPSKRAAAGAITRARMADPAREAERLARLRAAMAKRRAEHGLPEDWLPFYRRCRRVIGKTRAREQILGLIAQGKAPPEARA